MYNKYDVKDLLNFARDHELMVISDEVYDHMVYDDRHRSFYGDYENVVVVNSFSKRFAMTGWRLGYMVTNQKWAQELPHPSSGPPSPP